MGAFLSYAIGSGIVLLTLYLVFRLTLSSENQHNYNRGIILSIYAVSFLALPLLHFFKGMHQDPTASPFALSDITMMITSVGVSQHQAPIWGTLLVWTFLAGMALMVLKTVVSWIQIVKVVRRGEKVSHEDKLGNSSSNSSNSSSNFSKGSRNSISNGNRAYTLVLIDDESLSPFSWMRYVVMSRKDYEQYGETILAHELGHVGLYHWVDLLIAQAVIIINWFNPAAWLMREELMLIHEYQADMGVINSGHNAKEYQMLLIRKAVGARLPSLANSLNHNKLKQRISMMYKEKSAKGRRFKALALVPAIAVALAATTIPEVQAAMSTIASSETTLSKVTDNSVNSQSQPQTQATNTSKAQGEDTAQMTAEEITVIGCGTMEKPNTWEEVQIIGVGAQKKPDAPANSTKLNIPKPSGTEQCKYFVNGKEMTAEDVAKINPENIQSISVFKEPCVVIDLKKTNASENFILSKDNPDTPEPEVIVGDKKMSMEEFSKTYTPNDIESITVMRSENKIIVTLKDK